jgi:hypothetical protein
MKNKKILSLLGLLVTGGVLIQSCKKLPQNTYSSETAQNFFQTPAQIAAGVAAAYTPLQSVFNGNTFQLNEATTDEMIIPTRGNNWYDGGEHQELWQHQIDNNNQNVVGAWTELTTGITESNFVLNFLQNLPDKPTNEAALVAEINVVRDYYLFLMTDLYGNIPLVTTYGAASTNIAPQSRADIYKFLVSNLLANVPLLSTDNQTSNAAMVGHFNQWGGDMLLAKVYAMAQVYTGTADWANAKKYSDLVIASGKYSLQPNFFDNFTYTNRGSIENIFTIPFNFPSIGGNSIVSSSLTYTNQLTYNLGGQPNNGFCSPTAFYNLFSNNDVRKKMWEVGQQFTAAGAPIPGVIISKYVLELSNPADSFAFAGARSIKYQPQPLTSGNASNDGVVFRLGDAYLMSAEAALEMGDAATAVSDVNIVRARAGLPALTTITLDQLLQERGREMAWEAWRRDDLIRFEVATGTPYFTGPRVPQKTQDAADKHTFLFPIPSIQIATNPLLKQNPGYL